LRKTLLFSYKGTTIAVCALEIIVKGVLVFLQFLTITKNEVNPKTKMLRLADIVVSFLMAGGLIVCGVLLTVYSKESVWRYLFNLWYSVSWEQLCLSWWLFL
jgi:hypothetical protein